jgi:CBS domain-containing protein
MTLDLARVRVRDCMHHGILTCDAGAPLDEVAAIMAAHRVHAVAVTNGGGQRVIAVVSDIDVVVAAANGEEATAREIAATEPLSIAGSKPVREAARMMAEHGVSHLVVLDRASGYPSGIISTLDIASLYARGEHSQP